jgi:hypothetical protein
MDDGKHKHKIRPFHWRDLLLIQQLQGCGLVLDYEEALVDGTSPMRDALRAYLPLGDEGHQTLVITGKNAFVQYICHKGSNRVRLIYAAPAPTNDDYADRWLDLLEQLTVAVGSKGTFHIVAEVSRDGPEAELMRRIGFCVFTRQMLFRLLSPPALVDELPPLPGLRPWQSTDDWGVRLLYANTVPQLAQQIEAPIEEVLDSSRWPYRLVLEHDGEIIAHLVARRGRAGNALRLLLHPEADIYVEALIRHGLAMLAGAAPLPVYCRVRRYESWLQAPLEAIGFEPLAHTVLLVKHTVARVLTPEWNRLPVLEGRAEMTTPVAHARLRKSLKS